MLTLKYYFGDRHFIYDAVLKMFDNFRNKEAPTKLMTENIFNPEMEKKNVDGAVFFFFLVLYLIYNENS